VTSVQTIRPIDTTHIKDPGLRALVLLAYSLGWNVNQGLHRPIYLINRETGVRVVIPTDTAIKASVFQANLSKIMTYSTDFTPTIELIDKIIAATKPNQDVENRLRLALGETAKQHRDRAANLESETPDLSTELTQRIEIPMTFEPVGAPPTAVEATTATHSMGSELIREPKLLIQSDPVMTASGEHRMAISRLWNDGSVTYKCKFCDYESDSLSRLTGHGNAHVKGPRTRRSKAQMAADAKAETKAAPRVVKVAPVERDSDDIIAKITDLVAPDLLADYRKLEEQYFKLKADHDELQANLDALQDLIGGMRKS